MIHYYFCQSGNMGIANDMNIIQRVFKKFVKDRVVIIGGA